MKQHQDSQQVKKSNQVEDNNTGEKYTNTSGNVKKNEDISEGDTKEKPTLPTTPATPETPAPPDPPRREYEDPGHEHTYNPPTANPSAS